MKIKTVNISPVIRALRSSTACSATAPCTAWSTAQGIPGISRKTADGSRTAQTAPSHMIRSIMIRSCRSCGRRNTFFWEINTYFAKFSENYVCEKMEPGTEFDYVLYFADGKPDPWYYCVKIEMGHTIYHRFTEADYRSLTANISL